MGICSCKNDADVSTSADEQQKQVTNAVDATAEQSVDTAADRGLLPAVNKTLATDDPEMAAKRAAYLARREAKKDDRRTNKLSSAQHLSELPEVEADIQYRFNFVVVGQNAVAITETICASGSAKRLPTDLLEKDKDEMPANNTSNGFKDEPLITSSISSPATSRMSSVNSKLYRCLCPVRNPLAPSSKEKAKLAKLVFKPLGFAQDIPIYKSQQEALKSVVVIVLNVEGASTDGTGISFAEQLQNFRELVEQMRQNSKAKQRPVRAVILGRNSETTRDDAENNWAALLADFQDQHGDLWKFGPVAFSDADALHELFSEIASVRIAHHQSTLASNKDDDDDDKDPDGVVQDFLLPVQEDDDDGVPPMRRSKSDASTPSNVSSEGCERPPCFEAECSGSECSASALELHARVFGERLNDHT